MQLLPIPAIVLRSDEVVGVALPPTAQPSTVLADLAASVGRVVLAVAVQAALVPDKVLLHENVV